MFSLTAEYNIILYYIMFSLAAEYNIILYYIFLTVLSSGLKLTRKAGICNFRSIFQHKKMHVFKDGMSLI